MNVRLQHFLSAENITQAQFADTINVARASVSHIIAGRNKPGFDFITGIMQHYPSLNIEWLLTGKGKMYKDNTPASSPSEPDLFSSEGQPETPLAAPQEAVFSAQEQSQPQKTLSPEPAQYPEQIENQKRISKILIFYDDNTFIELS